MEVHGQLRTYDVVWARKWLSHKAHPVVRVQHTLPILSLPTWRKVWVGDPLPLEVVKKMLPGHMLEWFGKAVEEFEHYEIAWSQHEG